MAEQRDLWQGGAGKHSLYGDIYPTNANYGDPQWAQDYLKLYYRNEFVQIMIDWMPAEAFRNWIEFIEEEASFEGIKFGEPYTFKGYEHENTDTGKITTISPFNEYLQWIDAIANWKMGVGWSRLYNEGSLLVFLDDNEQLLTMSEKKGSTNEILWKANPDPQGYKKFIVYQPVNATSHTGFEVHEANADGSIKTWKIRMMTEHMKASKTFIVDAERCIHLLWKKKENGWKAASRIGGIYPFCKMEEQTFQKLTKRAHDLAGGILTITGISGKAEADTLDNDLGSDLTSVDRLLLQEGREVDFATPDLKASGEFSAIFELYTKKLIRHMRITQETLDGEKQGAGLGGNTDNDVLTSYTEIYEIQEHYRNYLEKVFYKLGKKNTSFVYREILPEDMRVEQNMQRELMENENNRMEQTAGSAGSNDSGNQQSSGNGSQNSSREQTR